ncbi:MAG: DEAD/DEAH box helicase family protein [Planctomycetota bacterium]|jgi:superfamily II DNA or RNA helicase
MNSFPAYVKFRKQWRSYQQRVLSELEVHLDDNHLHVIAAPGSGKTVLGLEVARRLNHAALILSPTIAIRDQWVERFVNLFCPPDAETESWISRTIKEPRFLTASTYQGLHSAYTGRTEEVLDRDDESDEGIQMDDSEAVNARHFDKDALISKLKQLGVETLVLDEAHHLRSEWWKCLIDLRQALGGPTVVALTATPPYDVPPAEWERYNQMCGPVDSEISVPELVQARNLCPHQDYVYLSTPLEAEQLQIREFRKDVTKIFADVCANPRFAEALDRHPGVRLPYENVEQILSDPAFFSAIAIFLNHVEGRPPAELLRIIGVSKRRCPEISLEWMEVLLTGCLYEHRAQFTDSEELFETIMRSLKRIGAIERRNVLLRSTRSITKLLVSSMSKLNSISEIVKLESESLGDDLRMVVLTDFIREADLPRNQDDISPLKRIGVVPIFEQIRRSGIGRLKLGVLSGSLAVAPRQSRPVLDKIAAEIGMDVGAVRYSPLKHDDNFCEVGIAGRHQHAIVRLMTELFSQGGITVLVGTKSLLGEGWDAPSINSLILASYVGSYMLSNQMRGRAIRCQEGNPHKTANIWHLVCVEPGQKKLSDDIEMLSRRFKAFVGVSYKEPVITSGLERLDLGDAPFGERRIETLNALTNEKALDRNQLRDDWFRALESGQIGGVVDEFRINDAALPRRFIFWNTIQALLWQGLFWAAIAFVYAAYAAGRQLHGRSYPLSGLLKLVMVALIAGAVAALPKCLKALYLFARHGPVSSSIRVIGKALVRALAHAELVETDVSKLKVRSSRGEFGIVSCSLAGGTTYEKSLFLDAMQEILGPIANPRYIMVRKSRLLGFVRQDYHAVPQVLGRNKRFAEYFAKMWTKYVGPVQIVYTRSVQGRRALLKARGNSMSASFQTRCERVRAWK